MGREGDGGVTGSRLGEQLLVANFVLLGLAMFVHLAGVGSLLLNLVQEATNPHGIFASGGATPFENGEKLGRAIGYGLAGLYSFAGLAWIPLNAYGLWRRRPWARTSTIVYWATATVTLCCTPMGVAGIVILLRRDVRELFPARAT